MKYLVSLFFVLFLGTSLTAQWQEDGGNKIRTNRRVSLVTAGASGGNWYGNTNYKLSIDGKFAVEECRVQLDNAWPDYVFLPGYPLLALTQVQSFVEQQGHLPGMPSTQEVAEQELGLGEAHRLLTEKVEELALYLIQSHERKQRLLAEIERLEALLAE